MSFRAKLLGYGRQLSESNMRTIGRCAGRLTHRLATPAQHGASRWSACRVACALPFPVSRFRISRFSISRFYVSRFPISLSRFPFPLARFPLAYQSLAICLLLTTPCWADADLSDPEMAVQAGREGLQSQISLPWYDRQADDTRPLNLPPQRARNRATGGTWDMSWIGDIFTFLMWLVVAALIVAIVVALLRSWQQAEQQPSDLSTVKGADGAQIARVEALPVAIDQPLANLLTEAQRLAARGEYSLAMIYLFSHQLVEADKVSALRLRKGKTNRQYLRELRRNQPETPELPQSLERTMLAFERSFFGAHAPTREEFDLCLAGAQRCDALLDTSPEESVV